MERNKQPSYKTDFQFNLIKYKKHSFSNGCILYNLPYSALPVHKIVFVFPAGKKYQTSSLVSRYAGEMLFEGTKQKSQKQISEEFDNLGASVNISVSEDFSALEVLCITRHIPKILSYLEHILNESVFPKKQLKILARNDKLKFLINCEKVSFTARRNLFNYIFTPAHPYCRFAELQDYDKVRAKDVIKFYQKYYTLSKCFIIWVGKIEQEHFNLFEKLFISDTASISKETYLPDTSVNCVEPGRINSDKKDAKQSAIYIGRIVPGYQHPDFYDLHIFNTILGGYFGSRLMKNIREEKGYSYGISSEIISYLDASVFIAGTQVKVQHTEDAIKEIKKEIIRLQTEPIEKEELEQAKNYITGIILKSLDGPFPQSNFYMKAFQHNIDPDTVLEKYLDAIKHFNEKTVKRIANEYFNTEQLYYSISGKSEI